MKIRTTLAGLGALALVAIAVPQADALWAPPNSAPLTRADGATNGCIAEVPVLEAAPFDGELGILVKRQVTCPASAGVKRVAEAGSLYEVMADGSLREIAGPGDMGRSSNSAGFSGTTWAANFLPCDAPEYAGTHTYLVKGRLNTRTTVNIADQNPFIAKVGRIQTVTCP